MGDWIRNNNGSYLDVYRMVFNMKNITTDMIIKWIERCDSQLKLLQKATEFIHNEYYHNDSIIYQLEEDLQEYFSDTIRDHKLKKQMLEQMLIHCGTDNIVELFGYEFEDRITNRLPEYLRKEFYNFVYEM